MKTVFYSEKKPIKMWLEDLEETAFNQAKNLANLPFTFEHVALLPDAHSGFGMPIGGVLATEEVIIPNAVGVDIGCGMCAIKTSLHSIEKRDLQKVIADIKKVIPVGFNHHKQKQQDVWMPRIEINNMKIINEEYENALTQVGTLGGGNHFIEVQKGSDGFIWIMVHSGSRNIGKRVADYYNKTAIKLNEKWNSKEFVKQELAFLPMDGNEARHYFDEMNYCVQFALLNRKLMMERIKEVFTDIVKSISFFPIINIAHNYAKWEEHFNKNVIVHRKGATSAKAGEIGIVPGSQGSKSYIVEGLGNKDSFESCSHGAGRKMGRRQAQRELNLDTEIQKMNSQGIIHSIKSKNDLDEAAGAYKDIDTVMENQSDLVKILIELKPLAVVKG